MSLRTKPLAAGNLRGTIFTFEKAGDALPMHRHTAADVHITIVARGRIRIHGPEIGDTVHAAGAVIDWQPDIDHEFVAVDDGARVVNIVKG
jgi:quercetin dioxygenase-like cupin family protein